MRAVQFLIILLLLAVIGGAAAFFAYDVYIRPRKLDRIESVAVAAAPPVADPSLAAYARLQEVRNAGDPSAADGAYAAFLEKYPDSPKVPDARREWGELHSELLFSTAPSACKMPYTVGRGDALVKIASKFKTGAELIFRVNNLETINLSIGQQLLIPQLQMTAVVDRKAKTLTLLNSGEFFKEYPVLSVKGAGVNPHAETALKVADKIAVKADKRVAFGQKEYLDSEKSVLLSGGITIRGAPVADGAATPAYLPAGIVLSVEDADEIFSLLSRGDSVTIH